MTHFSTYDETHLVFILRHIISRNNFGQLVILQHLTELIILLGVTIIVLSSLIFLFNFYITCGEKYRVYSNPRVLT